MKKILTLALLASCLLQLEAGSQTPTLAQEIEADVLKALGNTKKPTPAISPAPSIRTKSKQAQPSKTKSLATPQPTMAPIAPPKPSIQVSVQQPPLQLASSVVNPNVYIINTTKHAFTAYTANSAESAAAGPGGFSQTSMNVDSNGSISLPLTSQSQQFIGAQATLDDPTGDGGMQTNAAPITLRTPWAMIDNKGTLGADNFQLQYLPALEQNAIVVVNPSTKAYTLTIMNSFTEQLGIAATSNQNPAYSILSINLPGLSTVPLPVLNNSNMRLHISYPKNGQTTQLDYPSDAGFYVVQEKQQGEIPRAAFNSNNFQSNTGSYLYLQQIDG